MGREEAEEDQGKEITMGLYKKGKSWYIDYYYPPGRAGKRVRKMVGR